MLNIMVDGRTRKDRVIEYLTEHGFVVNNCHGYPRERDTTYPTKENGVPEPCLIVHHDGFVEVSRRADYQIRVAGDRVKKLYSSFSEADVAMTEELTLSSV